MLRSPPCSSESGSEGCGVRVSVRGWSSGRPVPVVLFVGSVCVAGLRSVRRLRLQPPHSASLLSGVSSVCSAGHRAEPAERHIDIMMTSQT